MNVTAGRRGELAHSAAEIVQQRQAARFGDGIHRIQP